MTTHIRKETTPGYPPREVEAWHEIPQEERTKPTFIYAQALQYRRERDDARRWARWLYRKWKEAKSDYLTLREIWSHDVEDAIACDRDLRERIAEQHARAESQVAQLTAERDALNAIIAEMESGHELSSRGVGWK